VTVGTLRCQSYVPRTLDSERRPDVRFFTISGGTSDAIVGGDQGKFNASTALKAQINVGSITCPRSRIQGHHEYDAEFVLYGHWMLREILRLLHQPVSSARAHGFPCDTGYDLAI